MFKKLIKAIFPNINDKHQTNYSYFEESKNSIEEMQKTAVTDFQESLTLKSLNVDSIEEKYQKEFYDFLFGQSPSTSQQVNTMNYLSMSLGKLNGY